MSQSDIEISRRCVICGASVRAAASYCPQCGVPLQRQETKDLTKSVSEGIKEKKNALNNNETLPEKAATQPLSAFAPKILAQEQAHTEEPSGPRVEENRLQAQEQAQLKKGSITSEITEDECYWPMPERVESFSKGDTTPLENIEKLKGDTAPLAKNEEQKGQKAYEEVKAAPMEQAVPDQPLAVQDSGKTNLSAKDRSGVLFAKAEQPRSQIEKVIALSQEALDKASPDPSIRFAIVSIVLFIFFLLAFFLSRYLR